MKIADFILSHLEQILEEWEKYARTLAPTGSNMTSIDLRDHAAIMLTGIAADLRTEQSEAEEIIKSHGGEPRTLQIQAGTAHGLDRRDFHFTIEQVVAEYRALRSSVLRLWTAATAEVRTDEIKEIIRFNEAIDQFLAASVLSFAKATRDATEADGARKDQFLAMLAHELRNPLAPISAAAALLMMTNAADARVARASAIVDRQARHMATIVDDLLDVSRVTRGVIQLERGPLDLRHVIADAVEQVTPKIKQKNQRLGLDQPSEPIALLGDRKRLVQVVAKVLANASKYSPDGGRIELTVDADDDHVRVAVQDNGIGVAADFLPHVFDLFAQAEQTPDRSSGGLGMGLALVKSLVELHKGSVVCASEGKGRGSKFVISLPKPNLRTAQVDRRRSPRTSPIGSAKLKILVVDDNVDAAETLAMLLQTEGHHVDVFHNAADALQFTGRTVPDLFLLDIGLPDTDGNELARRLRAQAATRSSVIVALTGYGRAEDLERSERAGFDLHIVKPVKLGELHKLIACIRPRN